MIDINVSLLIQIANFLLMMILLNYVLYRPIRSKIKERKDLFSAFASDIDRLSDAADNKSLEMEKRLNEARRDGYQRKDQLKSAGIEEEKAIIGQATQEVDSHLEKIRGQITSEIGAAREALKGEIDLFSVQFAQKVLGRSLS